jgi:predicted dienelactone hydrolase
MSRLPSIPSFLRLALAGAAAVLILSGANPALAQRPVQMVRFVDASGGVIEVGIWTPDGAPTEPRPLIVISHGNGASFRAHSDTAEALAHAGFVVAALTHPGDNFRDMSRSLRFADRAPQVSALITFMTEAWEGRSGIDETRIGAFGFSAGGFTIASLAGAESDPQAILDHCAAHPDFFVCTLVLPQGLDVAGWRRTSGDPRVRAAVLAAPGFGFSFTDESLRAIRIPVQLWQAGDDQILPAPYHVESLRDRLPGSPEYHLVPGATHHDFLAACDAQMRLAAPEICQSNPGFDRAAFKQEFNAEVVRFFVRELIEARPGS